MLIMQKNWSLILSMHRSQTSHLGTFKRELFLVFKTSRIKNLLVLKWLNCFGECEEKKNPSLKISTFFYICLTIVPFQRDITKNIKMQKYRLLNSGVVFEKVYSSFPECLG
jgi:hypothetical protein